MTKEAVELNHTPEDQPEPALLLPKIELTKPLVEKMGLQNRFLRVQNGAAHRNFEKSRRNGREKQTRAKTLRTKYLPRDQAIQFQLAAELSPKPDLNVSLVSLIPESDSTTPPSTNGNPLNPAHLEPQEEGGVDPEVLEVFAEGQTRVPLSQAHLHQPDRPEDDYSEDSRP